MIGIEAKWTIEDPDATPCYQCKDQIFTPMHVMSLVCLTNATPIIKLCEGCYYAGNWNSVEEEMEDD